MQDISVLETLSEGIGQIKDAAVFVKGGVIEWVGTTKNVPKELLSADTVISLADHVVHPGLVNTHHHMFQCLTRCIAQVKLCMGVLFISERVLDACVVLLPTLTRPAACRDL